MATRITFQDENKFPGHILWRTKENRMKLFKGRFTINIICTLCNHVIVPSCVISIIKYYNVSLMAWDNS